MHLIIYRTLLNWEAGVNGFTYENEIFMVYFFNFQILPHLLSYMDVDKLGTSIDWGTLCIYTCSEDCSIGNTYNREYLFKQDVV